MKKQRIIVSILVAAVLAAGLYFAIRPREPSYKGRTANEWLDYYVEVRKPWPAPGSKQLTDLDRQQALELSRTALEKMAARTVPYILTRASLNESKWRTRYLKWSPHWPRWFVNMVPKPKDPVDPYMAGSMILECGPEALPPAIEALKSPDGFVRLAGISALVGFAARRIGTEQLLPVLITALGDSTGEVRQQAAHAVGIIGPKASNAVPALLINLDDRDVWKGGRLDVRAWTAEALGRIGPGASNSVPKLKSLFQDSQPNVRKEAVVAVWRISSDNQPALEMMKKALESTDLNSKLEWIDTIAHIGPKANAAVPLLQPLLQDTNAQLRADAAVAVWKINSDTTSTLPVLMETLTGPDKYTKTSTFDAMAAMGPSAKPAWDVLVKELEQASTYDRYKITNALFKIDPEAAAKVVK